MQAENKFVGAGSVMNNGLKDPARVMFFPYVVNAYNIYVLIKEMASH